MQRNIIVHHGSIKPNLERYDLSRSDEQIKPPKPKTQEVELGNSNWDETNFVGKIIKSRIQKGEILSITKGENTMNIYVRYLPRCGAGKTRKIKNAIRYASKIHF